LHGLSILCCSAGMSSPCFCNFAACKVAFANCTPTRLHLTHRAPYHPSARSSPYGAPPDLRKLRKVKLYRLTICEDASAQYIRQLGSWIPPRNQLVPKIYSMQNLPTSRVVSRTVGAKHISCKRKSTGILSYHVQFLIGMFNTTTWVLADELQNCSASGILTKPEVK
jgi:hypothetical protein